MKNASRLRPALSVACRLIALAVLYACPLPAVHAEGSFIAAANRVDVAYDDKRSVLYISNGNELVRYDVAGRKTLAPLALGTMLTCMDVSPDGETLAVADKYQASDPGAFYLINLSTLAIKRVAIPGFLVVPPGITEPEGSFSVAYGQDGSILISTERSGNLWRYVPATGAFTLLTVLDPEVMLKASFDHSIIAFATHDVGPTPYGRYRIADGNLLKAPLLTQGVVPYYFDVSVAPGSQEFAMYAGGNLELYDANFNQKSFSYSGVSTGYTPDAALGVTYNPTKNLIYFGWSETPLVYAFDTTTHVVARTFDMETPFSTFFYAPLLARMKTSADGSLLFVTTTGGVRFVTLDAVAPTGLVATTGDSSITLDWSPSPNATSYDIYVESSATGEDPSPVQVGITGTRTIITGLTNGTPYYFRVAAQTPVGLSTPSDPVSRTPIALPSAVKSFSGYANFGGAGFGWPAVAGATSYTLYEGDASGGELPVATGIKATNYNLTLPGYGVDYYFQLAGVNAAGAGPRSQEVAFLHAAAPRVSLAEGTYATPQLVTVSDTAEDAEIYYTTDGSVPTTSSNYAYGPILIDATTTLRTFVVAEAASNSAVTTVTYTIGPSALPAATAVSLQSAYNLIGIREGAGPFDGAPQGGIDGHGSAVAASVIGNGVVFDGRGYALGSDGINDVVVNSTVALPAGQFAVVDLIATAVNGSQANQAIVIHYADGTSTTAFQSFSDWHSFQGFAGESIATTMPYRLNADGSEHSGTYHLYGYSIAVNASKTLQSITLPRNNNVVVFAASAIAPAGIPINLATTANTYAISTDGVPTIGGGIDGMGSAYPASLLGASITWNGAPFTLLPADHLDGVALENLTVTAGTGSFSSLKILAAAVNGSKTSQKFIVNYTDGTAGVITQSLSDWHSPQGFAGETKVLTLPYRLNRDGSKHTGDYYLYGYVLPLDASKTVESLTLPHNQDDVVLAVTLSP